MSKVYSRFSPPPSPGIECGASMTFQHFKDECDINNIVARYPNGITPYDDRASKMQYGDFTDADIFDFQSAQNKIVEAQEKFGALPSDVRARFDNDPGKLLAFLADSNNLDEAAKLGLVVKKDNPPASSDGLPPADES